MALRFLALIAALVAVNADHTTIFTKGTEFFCGDYDCYELLGLQYGASKRDVKKAYRELAIANHPDKLPKGADLKAAKMKMNLINMANEVVGKSKSKKAYDAAFADPKGFYANQTTFWSREMYKPKTNVWFALFVAIASISSLQFYLQGQRYEEALAAYGKQPHVIAEAKKRADAADLGRSKKKKSSSKNKKKKKFGSGKKKEEKAVNPADLFQAELDNLVADFKANGVVEGGYAKPTWKSTCVGFLFISGPKLLLWQLSWFFCHTLLRAEYNDEEKQYLTYLSLGISQHAFEQKTEEEQQKLIGKELWITANLKEYKAAVKAEKAKEYEFLKTVPKTKKEQKKYDALRRKLQAEEEYRGSKLGL